MKKWMGRVGVTLFLAWQIAGALILLNNWDMVVNVFEETQQVTRDLLKDYHLGN